MKSQTLDLFNSALREIANGPKTTGFQQLTEGLMRRMAEKGATLEQLTDRKMLNRSRSTLEAHAVKFGIRFPDFIPANMRSHLQFIPSGDYLKLTGEFVPAVAAALQVVITEREGAASCAVPRHAFAEAKKALRKAGFEAKIGKKPKAAKVRANA